MVLTGAFFWALASPFMAQTPPTTNPTATEINAEIAAAVDQAETIADQAAETALDSAVPFFALPVIKPVTDLIIEDIIKKLGEQLSIALQTIGTFVVIDTQVGSEKIGISQALANLMTAEKSGDQNAIQQAIDAYQKAQSALENSDGSALPHA